MTVNKNRRILSSTVVILFVLVTWAVGPQTGYAQGESAVPFLLIAPNARADGMGEAGVALSDDAAASHWNPAGLGFQLGQELSITHSAWLPQFQQSDLFYDYLAYRNHIDEWGGTFAATITYLNLGEFIETGDDPTPLSTFKAYEMAVTAGYATRVFDEFGLGVNLRYIRSSLAPFNVQGQQRKGIASSVSFDIGALWKPHLGGDIGDRFSVGFNLSNLGPKLTYIDAEQADPLPTNLGLGFAGAILKTEHNNINFVLDFNRILVRRYAADTIYNTGGSPTVTDPHVDNLPKALFSAWGDRGLKKVTIGGGLEYWYDKLVAIRCGYFYEAPPPDNGGRRFLTFGAGIRYDIYGFDFSYLSAIEETSPFGETLRFTLLIAWGGPQQQ